MSGDFALGVSVTGNGGLDTTYYGNVKCAMGAPGVFCGGKAGVDLNQALISVGYAQRFGALSLGIAPVMAVRFSRPMASALLANSDCPPIQAS